MRVQAKHMRMTMRRDQPKVCEREGGGRKGEKEGEGRVEEGRESGGKKERKRHDVIILLTTAQVLIPVVEPIGLTCDYKHPI